MITAVLNGELPKVNFIKHPVFGLEMPVSCPGVPTELLNPRDTWKNGADYDAKARSLAQEFNNNFSKFADQVKPEVLAAAPKV
jgi:phosphoenolpyruvate carboxykinase (ATP)